VARRDGGVDGEVGRDVVARREGERRARRGRREGLDRGGEGGGARWDGRECRTGICGGRTGWEDVRMGRTQGTAREGARTKGKGEIGSLDHVRMRYVGSFGASSCSSSVESSVLSSSSCSGNPLRRCKTSFLMIILLVH
jgi:hypothetical protein